MENSDGLLCNSKKIQRTKILPLRWIGNISGEFAANHLVEAIHMDDHDDHSFMYQFHGRMWLIFNKPYTWWGTYYIIDTGKW
jgi:hypothetical protein